MKRLHFWALAVLLVSCGTPTRTTDFKVVVLGFDGVDPDLVRQWMDHFPNIAALAQSGTFTDLGTTNPPESPVAWASFATGTNPGKHGIFDFLKRDPKLYMPDIGLVERTKPKFLFGSIPVKAPTITNNRQGKPFWKIVDEAGYSSVNLRIPLELPPTKLEHGRLVSGLGVPDVGGTWGTYHYLATDLSAWDLSENASTEFGGRQVLLEMNEENNSLFHADVFGPPDPRETPKPGTSNRIKEPIAVERDEQATSVILRVADQTQTVKEGQWSDWFRFSFDIGPFVTVKGVSRFYVLETYPEVRLYLMPISLDPKDPPIDISTPSGYVPALAKEMGYFKTLGWIHETWGLNEEQIDEGVFLEDLFRNMSNLEKTLLRELDERHASLYTAVFTATDSVSHMFYRLLDDKHPRYDADLASRYGDAILRVYQRMDAIIGEVRKRLDEKDLLVIVSDHGFHSWRKEFNTNTWLARNGYLHLKGMESDPTLKKIDQMFSGGSFFPNVDWSRSKAYALGLGHIYINLKGREGQGIVEPGEEFDKLVGEIRERIVQFRDPDTDELVLVNAYDTRRIYTGDQVSHGGDIQLSFQSGYRTSWQTSLGAVPPSIIVANLKKWSGDHCASDIAETSGFLVSNRKIADAAPSILDVAPTVCKELGAAIPARIDGKPWNFSLIARAAPAAP